MSRIQSRNRRHPRRAGAAMVNETLESRRLFAAVAWDGGGDGGNWSDPNNWSNNLVPTASDDVTINVAASPTVLIGAAVSAAARSLDCNEAIDIRGTLSVSQTSAVRAYSRLQGTVTGAGDLQVHGYLEVLGNAARFTGAGRTTVAPAGRLLIGAGANTVLTLERNLYVQGGGQVDWVQGEVRLSNATIDNAGTWRCSDAGSTVLLNMRGVGGANALLNSGRIDARGGRTTLTDVRLDNAGTVNVAGDAQLALAGGGTHGGRFDLQAASSVLALDGAHALNATSSVTGTGSIELRGGTTSLGGAITLPRFALHAGTLAGSGADVTFGGGLAWHGGRIGAAHGTTYIVPLNSTATVSGAATHTLSGTLRLDGVTTWTGGDIDLINGTVWNNRQVIINPAEPVRLMNSSLGAQWLNNGTVVKQGATAGASINVSFIDGTTGAIRVEGGQLALRGTTQHRAIQALPHTLLTLAGSHAFADNTVLAGVRGHLRVEGGANAYAGALTDQQSITFTGGSFTTTGAVRGVVNVHGGATHLNGPTNIIDGGVMAGGVLGGTGPLAVRGTFAWDAGTLAGAGAMTVEDEGTLQIGSAANHSLARRLVNNGFVFWTAGDLTLVGGGGTHVESNAYFAASSSADLRFVQSGATGTQFVNNGDFIKQGAGAVIVPPPPPSDGLDSINFANRGQVAVEGGRFEIRSPASHTGDFQVDAGAELVLSAHQSLLSTSALTGQGAVRLHGAQVQAHGNQDFFNGRMILESQSTIALRGARTVVGSVEVKAGCFAELPASVASAVLVTEDLNLHQGATFDLNDNALVVDYATDSPLGSVAQSIRAGYNNGAWNGTGLRSSTAAAAQGYGLACVEASDVFASFPATFAGYPVNDTAVLVRIESYGDANIDGDVNLSDFNRLAANFGQTSGTWSRGDWNYDGLVNLADFNLLAANFGRTAAPVTAGAADGDGDEKLFGTGAGLG